jgi:hypothetical protein
VTEKVRVWFGHNRDAAKVVNASRVRVAVRHASWDDFVIVPPNTRFSGNFRTKEFATLKPILPSEARPENIDYPVIVERATEADTEDLMTFVPLVLAEATLLPLSTTKIEKLVTRCANRQGGAIAGIIRGEDGIDASIGLDVVDSEISDHRYVRALWLGMHPTLQMERPDQKDPRYNYGRRLFEFAKWFHQQLEHGTGSSVLMQFDISTRAGLGQKLGMYERNATPIGQTFGFVSDGAFLSREAEVEAA